MVTLLLKILISSSSLFAQSQGPSAQKCDYYQTLESQYQCGPQAYFQSAYFLCEKYRKAEPRTNSEIQEFFPKVRFCLQNELVVRASTLTCQNLDQIALETHVDCYVQTGYCNLSWSSQTMLTWLTLPQLRNPLWRETASQILEACRQK